MGTVGEKKTHEKKKKKLNGEAILAVKSYEV